MKLSAVLLVVGLVAASGEADKRRINFNVEDVSAKPVVVEKQPQVGGEQGGNQQGLGEPEPMAQGFGEKEAPGYPYTGFYAAPYYGYRGGISYADRNEGFGDRIGYSPYAETKDKKGPVQSAYPPALPYPYTTYGNAIQGGPAAGAQGLQGGDYDYAIPLPPSYPFARQIQFPQVVIVPPGAGNGEPPVVPTMHTFPAVPTFGIPQATRPAFFGGGKYRKMAEVNKNGNENGEDKKTEQQGNVHPVYVPVPVYYTY